MEMLPPLEPRTRQWGQAARNASVSLPNGGPGGGDYSGRLHHEERRGSRRGSAWRAATASDASRGSGYDDDSQTERTHDRRPLSRRWERRSSQVMLSNVYTTVLKQVGISVRGKDQPSSAELSDGLTTASTLKSFITSLRKPPEERSEGEVKVLVRVIKLEFAVDLLRTLPDRMLRRICRNMTHLALRHGTSVFKEGETADCFYIVLRGRVRLSVGGRSTDLLRQGQGFGEVGIADGEPRIVTATAIGHCELGVVSREEFATVDFHTFEKNIVETTQFLRSVSIFQDMSEEELRRLAPHAVMESTSQAEHHFKPDSDGCLYFIKEGDAVYCRPMTERAMRHVRGRQTIIDEGRSPGLVQERASAAKPRGSDGSDTATPPPVALQHCSDWVEIQLLHTGQYFGFQCLLQEFQRGWIVRALGKMRFLRIDKAAFLMHATPSVMDRLRTEAAFNVSYVNERQELQRKSLRALTRRRPSLTQYVLQRYQHVAGRDEQHESTGPGARSRSHI